MAVASILAQKGREVVTAPPDRSLQDVATILAERKIGAIVGVPTPAVNALYGLTRLWTRCH